MITGIFLVLVFSVVYLGVNLSTNWGKSDQQVATEDASKRLNKLYGNIEVTTETPVKGRIDLDPVDVAASLPDISKFAITADSTTADYAEIFSSTEKAGTGDDGWLTDVAKEFNKAKMTVNGVPVSVKLRNIASGTAADYIRSGKYVPDAFTPSNQMWGEMVKASGVNAQLITERLVGNVPGIVISKAKHDAFVKKYGEVNVKSLIEAIASGEFSMGYTDPFASSTGLNFLVTTLQSFDSANLLSDKAIQGFESFQANVPFIASTTLQMREAAKSGALDGFVLEYQTYVNTAELRGAYVFTPFGARHDSPLYALGNVSATKLEIIKKFAEFASQAKYQAAAKDKGFNGLEDYQSKLGKVEGSVLAAAQKVWKEKKNSGKPIAAVFVADVSGSMAGEPLNRLKESLIKGQKYLGRENSIGLVSYSSKVAINLPIGKYDTNQQSLFVGTVDSLRAGGNTATFNGVIAAIKLLQDHMAVNPNVKPLIFLLSDGETNVGLQLKEVQGLIEHYKIPIYTIGYNADIKALQSISSINEAASINADTDDVVYKLGNLFNVQM
ncbi:vWA domain-containing protein [Paenibacillus koleovorans]|uniref:vWA domain-containing protein n=1 Tax=Paenibacillus koleovorans TaxID=121608 RepID=UPI000FDCCB4A|nr:VWA domain-containing protein [Paenibacillus koleovorans]